MGEEKLPPGVRIRHSNLEVRFYMPDYTTGKRIRRSEVLAGGCGPRAIKEAELLLAEVKQEIKFGLLTPARYLEHFPNSPYPPRTQERSLDDPLFEEQAQRYLDTFGPAQEKGTRAEYVKVLNRTWMPFFAGRTVRSIRASEIEHVVAQKDFRSVRTRNNNLTPMRGLFRLLEKDRVITPEENPMRQIEWQRPPKRMAETVDPMSVDEMRAVLGWMKAEAHPVYYNYFRLAFATGMRNPSEITALHWDSVDLRTGSIRIKRKLTRQELYDTTKTGDIRDVALPEMAVDALEAMKEWTFLQGDYVFRSPHGNTLRSPTKTLNPLWNRCLKKLGMRQREMRQTRHTAATHWIMAGANIKWVANQLGHDVSTLENHYARWLNEQGTRAELDKINAYSREEKTVVRKNVTEMGVLR